MSHERGCETCETLPDAQRRPSEDCSASVIAQFHSLLNFAPEMHCEALRLTTHARKQNWALYQKSDQEISAIGKTLRRSSEHDREQAQPRIQENAMIRHTAWWAEEIFDQVLVAVFGISEEMPGRIIRRSELREMFRLGSG